MLAQTFAITGINIKSIPERWASSLVIVIGLAGVVAVFTALLAMAHGFASTLKATGRQDAVIIMRGGSDAELNSGLDRDADRSASSSMPGIRTGADGKPQASAEMMVIAELMRKDDIKNGANITVRGVDPEAFALRPQLKIVGRSHLHPGAARADRRRRRAAPVPGGGDRQGGAHARLGLDGRRARSRRATRTTASCGPTSTSRAPPSAAPARVPSVPRSMAPAACEKLKAGVAADPRLNVDVVREQDYFNGQTKQFRKTIGFLAGIVTAHHGARAPSLPRSTACTRPSRRAARRSRRCARSASAALPVLVSVMMEALLLALAGGILGALIAYVLFNNLSVSTLGQNFTQVVFNFKVTPELVIRGLVIAVRHRHGRRLPAGDPRRALAGDDQPAGAVGPGGTRGDASAAHSASTSASGWSQETTRRASPLCGGPQS